MDGRDHPAEARPARSRVHPRRRWLGSHRPVHAKNLVLQAGGYGEHTIESVQIDNGKPQQIGGVTCNVRLAPGAGARLLMKVKRYCNQPTVAFPWST